mmetsp:Transcript_44352/g.70228  ORF Transcript_44352/g.70228 Transcript_44352/m.70228 type:complete len:224 (+) Transcript_44352:115-786(+)
MASSRLLISSANILMASFSFAMAFSRSDIDLSNSFFLSLARSSCVSQYSFLSVSDCCSFCKTTTISSIILIIFAKSTFFPSRANAMKFNSGCPRRTVRSLASACCRCSAAVTCNCKKLEPEGSVFLNSSRASSSLSTLIVSAKARSSCERNFTFSSCSAAFVAQFFFKSAKNFLSSSKPLPVSSRSSFISTISTWTFPRRTIFSSMALVKASTSFCLAAMSSS